MQSHRSGLGVHSCRYSTQPECLSWVEHSHRCLHWPLHSAAATNSQTHQSLYPAGAGGLPWGGYSTVHTAEYWLYSVSWVLWPGFDSCVCVCVSVRCCVWARRLCLLTMPMNNTTWSCSSTSQRRTMLQWWMLRRARGKQVGVVIAQ